MSGQQDAVPAAAAVRAVPVEVVVEVQQAMAAHFLAIDAGDGPAWAAGFTEDGEFSSPTYGEPVVGPVALAALASRFPTSGEPGSVPRHVMSNLLVLPGDGVGRWQARSLLQVSETGPDGTVRVLRLVELRDELVTTPRGLRIRRRRVVPARS